MDVSLSDDYELQADEMAEKLQNSHSISMQIQTAVNFPSEEAVRNECTAAASESSSGISASQADDLPFLKSRSGSEGAACMDGAELVSGSLLLHIDGNEVTTTLPSRELCNVSVLCAPAGRMHWCQLTGCQKSFFEQKDWCDEHCCSCEHPGCTNRTSEQLAFCKEHALSGQEDGHAPLCEERDCWKQAIKYGRCRLHCMGSICAQEGCTNSAKGKSAFCIFHYGGKICEQQGCARPARKLKDFCGLHGGLEKARCSKEGCVRKALGGYQFCSRHGGGRRCRVDNCERGAISKSDFCVKHGGGKRCAFEGCTKAARRPTDFCASHGGGRRCKHSNGCTRPARGITGLCFSHGGKIRCRHPGCTKMAPSRYLLCMDHGGKCTVEGCATPARDASGLCMHHGGGRLPCQVEGCDRQAMPRAKRSKGVCIIHAGGSICGAPGCGRSVKHKSGMCVHHRGGSPAHRAMPWRMASAADGDGDGDTSPSGLLNARCKDWQLPADAPPPDPEPPQQQQPQQPQPEQLLQLPALPALPPPSGTYQDAPGGEEEASVPDPGSALMQVPQEWVLRQGLCERTPPSQPHESCIIINNNKKNNNKTCQHPKCSKFPAGPTKFFCVSHGGGYQCQKEGCIKNAERPSDLCIRHGGGRMCDAEEEGCRKVARHGSRLCGTHGGGRKCEETSCNTLALGSFPYCYHHCRKFGVRRCAADACTKLTLNAWELFCGKHGGSKFRKCVVGHPREPTSSGGVTSSAPEGACENRALGHDLHDAKCALHNPSKEDGGEVAENTQMQRQAGVMIVRRRGRPPTGRLKSCQEDGCTKLKVGRTEFCLTHGRLHPCRADNCHEPRVPMTNFCPEHGGIRRTCKHEGCQHAPRKNGLCKSHGGGNRCEHEGCPNVALSASTRCSRHGGGRRCHFVGCEKGALARSDFCIRHGGGRRCQREGCTKAARARADFCHRHRQEAHHFATPALDSNTVLLMESMVPHVHTNAASGHMPQLPLTHHHAHVMGHKHMGIDLLEHVRLAHHHMGGDEHMGHHRPQLVHHHEHMIHGQLAHEAIGDPNMQLLQGGHAHHHMSDHEQMGHEHVTHIHMAHAHMGHEHMQQPLQTDHLHVLTEARGVPFM